MSHGDDGEVRTYGTEPGSTVRTSLRIVFLRNALVSIRRWHVHFPRRLIYNYGGNSSASYSIVQPRES